MNDRDPDTKEGYPYYPARGSSQPQQQESDARADAQPSHFGDYGERQQPSRIACCLSCRNCYFYQTDENQTLCPACSNDATQFESRQRLILCPTWCVD
jgi:rubrerythrin